MRKMPESKNPFVGMGGYVYIIYRGRHGHSWADVCLSDGEKVIRLHTGEGGWFFDWVPRGKYKAWAELRWYKSKPKDITVDKFSLRHDFEIPIP